ncbi:hypothetical protein HFO99_19445 [Rhizobium leguminosarum]|uniref:hypothetical protein n=1 Tax=Rhizobium leguminosarum TaxID=384 RepID=UPI001C9783DA|nr:hypothetical protein [Rhizobium leguminosarum]MBY5336083.1 hypothetical protein [Rhizobium leguminosarum]
MLIDDKLPETIASWTTSLEVAKAFKGGVAWGDQDRSIMLAMKPPAGSVVANLERLYDEPEFQKAVALYGQEIEYFYNGAGKYGNTQKEVVLELGSLSSASICSYGGYSSPVDGLRAGSGKCTEATRTSRNLLRSKESRPALVAERIGHKKCYRPDNTKVLGACYEPIGCCPEVSSLFSVPA